MLSPSPEPRSSPESIRPQTHRTINRASRDTLSATALPTPAASPTSSLAAQFFPLSWIRTRATSTAVRAPHTNRRRAHALRAIFLTHGDNGKVQFNYSGLGGDMASAALANTYYPRANRGPNLFFANWAVLSAGRAANVLAQEFLGKFTTHARAQ